MSEYKVWINYFLFRLNIRKILPNKFIKSVEINECNENLEQLDIYKYNIILDSRMKAPVYLRKTVCEKIYSLAKSLEKENLRIKLYDAYRSLEEQEESWKKRLEQTKKEHPDLNQEDIERLTKLKVANPTDSKNVGGHQTGGAIDISLTDLNGVELDMGTKYEEYNEKTKTYSKNIKEECIKNRKMLLKKMKELDFVNFPAEWWHFCYGDKMWAAYKCKKKAIYGYIEVK